MNIDRKTVNILKYYTEKKYRSEQAGRSGLTDRTIRISAFTAMLAAFIFSATTVSFAYSSTQLKVSEAENTSEQDVGAAADISQMSDGEYKAYLKELGFPASYRKKLLKLHKIHPNWVFNAYKTNIKWDAALKKQTRKGVSLVSKSMPSSYRASSFQYESGWYMAVESVVEYFMDPRNFLNEDRIFMFEELTYNEECHKKSVVKKILKPTKLPGYGFTAGIFMKACAKYNISPVFLASRARQETGGGSDAISGKKILGKTVYNPFNIGAFGSTNPLYKGLLYAYAKGWTTPSKAVKGGAKFLAKNYISQGQNTVYYQRFNVRNGISSAGTHQYMTNIMAPYSESLSTAKSYAQYGITDKSLVFEIPVYKSMPSKTSLPK